MEKKLKTLGNVPLDRWYMKYTLWNLIISGTDFESLAERRLKQNEHYIWKKVIRRIAFFSSTYKGLRLV